MAKRAHLQSHVQLLTADWNHSSETSPPTPWKKTNFACKLNEAEVEKKIEGFNKQQKKTLCLDAWQPGSVFKRLHAQQSEIILEFLLKNQSNPSENYRSLFRNVKRFQL